MIATLVERDRAQPGDNGILVLDYCRQLWTQNVELAEALEGTSHPKCAVDRTAKQPFVHLAARPSRSILPAVS